MKYAKAIAVGILSWAVALDLGWHLTNIEFLELLVCTTVFYIAGFFWSWTRVEPERPVRKHKEPQIYTLSKEDYYRLEETA